MPDFKILVSSIFLLLNLNSVVGQGLKDINPVIKIGSRLDVVHHTYPHYQSTFLKEFNSAQLTWFAGWGIGWPSKGKFRFDHFNKNINWCLQNNMYPMMHMLLGWNMYMPKWLVESEMSPQEMESQMYQMIDSIMISNDNAHKVQVWNVINELFEHKTGLYRADSTMWWNKMGWEQDASGLPSSEIVNKQHPIFVRKAFEYCRKHTPNKLELRDYSIETLDSTDMPRYIRHKAIYQLAKHMLNTGVPLDAIGVQGHHYIQFDSFLKGLNVSQSIKRFRDLGLDVYITEMDVSNFENKVPWSQALAIKQRDMYKNYVKQCIEGGATIIHTWGLRDKDDRGWRTLEKPLLFDENLQKKPAYDGMKEGLKPE
ncbi:MAG: endo-1,4-beta-xylanase [Leadbetterella sp.]